MTAPLLTSISTDEAERVREVLCEYRLSMAPKRIARNTVGLMNKTYILDFGQEKLVLRESGTLIDIEHLGLEIEVLLFLEKNGFGFSPRLIPNKGGEYSTKWADNVYMLQSFVPGEMRVTMDNVDHFDGAMLDSYFGVMAKFAKITRNFAPSTMYPKMSIAHYPAGTAMTLNSILENLPLPGKALVAEQKNAILDAASRAHEEMLSLGYDSLPKQLVHLDVHPGNVHFQGNNVVGLFDFDWVTFDCRISDIAMSIAQSCHSKRGGPLVKSKIARGLKAYASTYGASEFDRETESRLVTVAIQAAVLGMTDWALNWYKANDDHPKAMVILNHWVNLCSVDWPSGNFVPSDIYSFPNECAPVMALDLAC